MSSAGPPGVEPLGRRLAVVRARLAQLQDSYQGMLTWRGQSVRSRGVTVADVAYAQQPSGPPKPPTLALLGAAAGLAALYGLRLLVGAGGSPAGDPEQVDVTLASGRSGGRIADTVLVPGAGAYWPAERVGGSR